MVRLHIFRCEIQGGERVQWRDRDFILCVDWRSGWGHNSFGVQHRKRLRLCCYRAGECKQRQSNCQQWWWVCSHHFYIHTHAHAHTQSEDLISQLINCPLSVGESHCFAFHRPPLLQLCINKTNDHFTVVLEWRVEVPHFPSVTRILSGEAKVFIQRADWIAANVTAKLDFYFLSTAVARECAAFCHLSWRVFNSCR